MNLSRDVKRDLLTLVEAGEASADTRALVARWLAEDPELAREAAAARATALPPTPPPPSDAGKRALDETRKLLKNRNQTGAVALVFTLLPLAFTFDSTGITFLLIRDEPRIGLAWWFTAAVMWGFHFHYRRRLRVSGL